MIKKRFAFLLIPIFVVCLIVEAHAHPGRTDSSGGHTNHSTGEYHYHHGYSAHDHYDMDGDRIKDCPYDFNDNTESSSSTRSNDGPRVSEYQDPTQNKASTSFFERLFLSLVIGACGTYLLHYFILLFNRGRLVASIVFSVVSIVAYIWLLD